ncbi:MAG: pilus assembly protein PilM [Verrucomicrobiota bacterium]|nr:pilus assembly protein PilM [Verrucomicrobiota bacterium]
MSKSNSINSNIWSKGLKKLTDRLKRRGEVTALDIDQRMLRIVHVTMSRGTSRVRRIELIPLPKKELDLKDPVATGKWIGKQLKDIRLSPGVVVMAVRRGECVLKEYQLPPLKDIGEMASMVRVKASRDLPFPESQASIDFTVTRIPTKKEIKASSNAAVDAKANVVVSAIKNETLGFYKTIAESAGFTLAGLGLRPMASFRVLKTCVPNIIKEAVALISIRRHEVDVDILIDGRLVFSRELSADLNISEDSQESDKQKNLIHITKEIFRCLHSYEGSGAYQKLDHLLIAGGTGMEDELCQCLNTQSDAKWKTMPTPTGLRLPKNKKDNTTRALTSLGLALGFADEGGLSVNFLSPKRPIVNRNEGRMKWILIISLLIAGSLMLFSIQKRSKSNAQAELDSLSPRYLALKKEERTYKTTILTGNAVTAWSKESEDWLGHFAFLSAILPKSDKVYLKSFGTRRITKSDPKTKRSISHGIISFQLQAKDSYTLHNVEKLLREAGYEFQSVPQTPGSDRHGYSFRASFELIIPKIFKHNLKDYLKTNTPPARIKDDIHANGISIINKKKDSSNG